MTKKFWILPLMDRLARPDSLLFDKGEDVAFMETDEGFARVTVVGDINLEWKGENYTLLQDFPDDLKDAIRNGDYDNITVNANNWFEITVYNKDRKVKMCDVCEMDLPDISDKEMYDYLLMEIQEN